ncbi:hypothetical protein ACJMK2_006151 [Sinanodonta woodiana]|uniref:Protein FRA10AC1 n=1 Tax=Sinanodonta woodiana TaxID=1069815 RepID=A0ABD3VVE3_SINWO
MVDNPDLVQIHNAGDYGSEFEYDSEAEKKRAKYNDLADKTKAPKERAVNKRKLEDEYSKEEGTIHRLHFLSLDAYSRHKMLVNTYLSFYGGSVNQFKRDSSRDKTDMDVIRENHQFLWSDEDDEDELDWGKDLAKKYYNKLFKTYAIVDLSRYKENKIALRWRINQEVVDGKGQFMCGNRKCKESEGLRSWEVNFAYVEHGQKKNALVKLRLCPDCSYKLNYHHRKKEVLPKKKEIKETEKSSKKIRSDELSDDKAESSHSGTIEESDKTKGGSESNIDDESEVWKGPVKLTEEKSREEEFDEYFADMFL